MNVEYLFLKKLQTSKEATSRDLVFCTEYALAFYEENLSESITGLEDVKNAFIKLTQNGCLSLNHTHKLYPTMEEYLKNTEDEFPEWSGVWDKLIESTCGFQILKLSLLKKMNGIWKRFPC